MVKLGHVALNGTKMKANAPKRKAMSYGRMRGESARLESEIVGLSGNAQRSDDAEDGGLGRDVAGGELPKELALRKSRLARIEKAMAELEAEAKEAAAQAAVDRDYRVVVAATVTNQAADSPHVESMTGKIEGNDGRLSDEMSTDAGYYSDAHVNCPESKSIDVYMPPCRLKHQEYRHAKPEPVNEDSILTDAGREKYGFRKVAVEPVFGQIKRCMGCREFSMRGQEACEAERNLVCAAHNPLKLFRHGAVAMAKQVQERMQAAQTTNVLAVAACYANPRQPVSLGRGRQLR